MIYIGFLMLFSLDVFSPGLSFWQIALGLLMHNIPALILLAAVLISWKHELVGGIVFTLFGALYILRLIITVVLNSSLDWRIAISWSFAVTGPAFLIGILFIINWKMNRKAR